MPRAPKHCGHPGCTTLVTGRTWCPDHDRARRRAEDTRRPSRAARGYDAAHDALRAQYARRMDAGERFSCWRCGSPIDPRSAWQLGHDDLDRTIHRGPEHRRCNLAAPRFRAAYTKP